MPIDTYTFLRDKDILQEDETEQEMIDKINDLDERDLAEVLRAAKVLKDAGIVVKKFI